MGALDILLLEKFIIYLKCKFNHVIHNNFICYIWHTFLEE